MAFLKSAAQFAPGMFLGGLIGGAHSLFSKDPTEGPTKNILAGMAIGGMISFGAFKAGPALAKVPVGKTTIGKAAGGALKGLGKGTLKAGAKVALPAGMVGLAAYGFMKEPYESGALTQNLDITSGPLSRYLTANPSVASLNVMMAISKTQGMTNLRGDDYVQSVSNAGEPTSGPMMFSPMGYERGISKAQMNVDGNLSLALSTLRRGR